MRNLTREGMALSCHSIDEDETSLPPIHSRARVDPNTTDTRDPLHDDATPTAENITSPDVPLQNAPEIQPPPNHLTRVWKKKTEKSQK